MVTTVAQVNGCKICGKPVMPTERNFRVHLVLADFCRDGQPDSYCPPVGTGSAGRKPGRGTAHLSTDTPSLDVLTSPCFTNRKIHLSAKDLVIDGFKKGYSVLFGKIKSLSNLITIQAFSGA